MVAVAGTLGDRCALVERCGGCLWGLMPYAAQVEGKQAQIREALRGIPGVDTAPVRPLLEAAATFGYRNKGIYPVQPGWELGLYARHSHQIVPIASCPVLDPRVDRIMAHLQQDLPHTGWIPYDEQTLTGTIRYVSVRIGRRTGECLITVVSRDPDLVGGEAWAAAWLELPGVVGVCVNENSLPGNRIWGEHTYTLAGTGMIQEVLGGITFNLDSCSFFQAHTEQAEALFTWAIHHLPPVATAVDAYCGVGTLALLLAQRDPHVQITGLEVVPQALAWAEIARQWNGIPPITWVGTAVEAALETHLPADLVILDPPRKGCDPKVIQGLLCQRPAWILYISCHLPSLVRDLQMLTPAYRVWQWRGADFFPHTPHVETGVILQRLP